MGQEKFTSVAVAVLYQEADGLHALADSLDSVVKFKSML